MGNLSTFIAQESKTVEAIYAYHKARGDAEPQRGYLGASIIGHDCERFLWYTFRGLVAREFSGRLYRLFETGDREEFRFTKELKAIGCEVHDVDASGEQFEVTALGGHFSGHMDGCAQGVPEAPKAWHVLEFKTHNDKSYAKLLKEGVASKPLHVAQMQAYMGHTKMKRALYLARNKNTDALYSERVNFDSMAFDALMEKAERVIHTSTPPERITDRQDTWACKWCDAYTLCWGVDRDGVVPDVAVPLPAKTCKSCCHATALTTCEGSQWSCSEGLDPVPLPSAEVGHKCPAHLILPGLVTFAEPQDADRSSITFKSVDGTVWTHGQGHVTTEELLSGPRPTGRPLPTVLVEDEPLALIARYDWGDSEKVWSGPVDGLVPWLGERGYPPAVLNTIEPKDTQDDEQVSAAEYALDGEDYLIVRYRQDGVAAVWKGKK